MKPATGTEKVNPAIALALLDALRASDTPSEVIEDESFRFSLPRRLGLNEVVDTQMRRYAQIRDRRGTISPDEYSSLLGLIDRRPDDTAVFAAAGRRLGESWFSQPRSMDRVRLRVTPSGVRRRKLIRAMREAARALEPAAAIVSIQEPELIGIEVRDPPLADTSGGSGCALLTGVLEVCAERRGMEGVRILHPRCVARGDDHCRWVAAEGAEEEAAPD
jgi:predicted hydrocarbon binding protein